MGTLNLSAKEQFRAAYRAARIENSDCDIQIYFKRRQSIPAIRVVMIVAADKCMAAKIRAMGKGS